MKVLLMTPPFVKGFMRNARWDVIGISGSDWFPIYLGYCAGLLEKHGHTAKLIDPQVENLSCEETYRIAQEFEPELIVFYYSRKVIDHDLKVAAELHRRTGGQILMVGPSASIDPVGVLKLTDDIKLLGRGEFDFTVLDLANKVPLNEIEGLYWKNAGGEVIENRMRPPAPAAALDEFPFVTDVYRRHLKIRNYRQTAHQYPLIDLFTGRGCAWGKCTFCLWPHTINKGAGYRIRNIKNVLEEFKFIKSEIPYVKEIFLQDDTMPKERGLEIAGGILESGLKICWSCYMRATPDYDLPTLKLLKRSGCRTIHVGYESYSQEILKTIKKGTSIKNMELFTTNANKAGLFIVADFITGLPGETVQTIKETIEWAKKLPVQRYTITLPKPYPQTPLYDLLKKNNWLDENERPDYPELSSEEIYKWNKWSLKQVYLSPHYFFRMALKPLEWDRILRSAIFFLPHLISEKGEQDNRLEW